MPIEIYNYVSFEHRDAEHAAHFYGGAAPGELAPAIDLPTIDGSRFRLADFRGRRPVLFAFGCITCPLTAAAAYALKHIRNEFAPGVEVVTIYVREAHPGEHFSHHTSAQQKMDYARQWARRDNVPWVVAVDSLDGHVHRAYATLPNAAYLIGSDGHIAFRAVSAANGRALRSAVRTLLRAEARGDTAINLGEDDSSLVPTFQSAMEFDRAIRPAGKKAARDYRRSMGPVMYMVSKVLSRFEPVLHRDPPTSASSH